MEQATATATIAETASEGSNATSEFSGDRAAKGSRRIPILQAIRAYAPDFSSGAALDCLCRCAAGGGARSEAATLCDAIRHLHDALDQGWRPAPESPGRNEPAGEDATSGEGFGINEFLDDWELIGDRRAAAMFLMLAGTFFDGETERLQYLRSALAAAERAHRAVATTEGAAPTAQLVPLLVQTVHKEEKSAGENRGRAHICERCWTSSWEACVEEQADAIRDPATGGWMYCVHCTLIAAFHTMDENREMAERDAQRLATFLRHLLARTDMSGHPCIEAGQNLLSDLDMVVFGTSSSHGERALHFAPTG